MAGIHDPSCARRELQRRPIRDGAFAFSAASIVIDLEAVEFLDSSGLRLLRRLSAHATEADANFVVVAPPTSVARSVIEIVSLSQELGVQDSLQPPNRP